MRKTLFGAWKVSHTYVPSSPGLKMKVLKFYPGSFGLSLMVSVPPLCRQCGGRFGRISIPPYCELCGQLAHLTNHLYSKRFPTVLVPLAESALREALHKCLSASDSYWGAQEAEARSSEKPKEESKEAVGEPPVVKAKVEEPSPQREKEKIVEESREEPKLPGLSVKAASPCRPVSPAPREDRPEAPSAAASVDRSGGEVEEERKKSKAKKRHKRSRSGSHPSRSRRRRRGEAGRERDSSPRGEAEPRRPSRQARRAKPSSARAAHGGDQRPRSPSRSLQGRDYSGYYQQPNWSGPIPAGGSRRRVAEGDRSPRHGKNKGLKKQRQQERARARGGWNNRGGRGWHRRW